MNRRQLLVGTGSLAATALAGCLGGIGGDGEAAAQSDAPTVEQRTGRKVVVSNAGEVTGEPDLAVLRFGVESNADTASAVRTDLADRSEQLRQALLDYGLDEDAVTTSEFRIHERIDRRQMEEDGVNPRNREEAEEYVYYVGTHAFTVELEAIDEVGAVIDTAVDAGADTVDRVTFTLSDEKRDTLREEALRKALQGARSEAETIADEVGTTIAEATVVDASEGQVSPVHRDVSYQAAATEAAGDGGASTSVEPGDVTVTARVRVEYRME